MEYSLTALKLLTLLSFALRDRFSREDSCELCTTAGTSGAALLLPRDERCCVVGAEFALEAGVESCWGPLTRPAEALEC